ncbi:alkene reductase [Pseudoalteromonas ruthenica]|uniref:alkene reductase n=1 Tax=Pseudoalteromonas ruthenica TaxID=151081 RepID=UPI001108DFF0|nr:alkene reductase [Pseudoalteromonas ruthenica]TLX49571.1 alkene reductase [Pseudoalteromonas ruthenica]
MTDLLLQPYALNDELTLKNRILMAPLTRCMADDNLVPTEKMAAYYARRADAGLIISEATIIRPDAQGYPNVPGIFTSEQIQGWRNVTEQVHDQGGKIFCQLWHVGRVAHPHFFAGDVLGASAIGIEATVPRMRELSYQTPKAASEAQIEQLVADYAKAAENAIEAGFDGVEIHGANGYLIDQFLHHSSNQRNDNYGGNAANRARFALEVVDAVVARVGAAKVGLRLSPGAYFLLDEGDEQDTAVFDYLLEQLNHRNLAYLHLGIFDDSMRFPYLGGNGSASQYLRKHYNGNLVGVGSYTPEQGAEAISNEEFDLLALGRPFIANPDLVAKVKAQKPLTPYTDDMLAELY